MNKRNRNNQHTARFEQYDKIPDSFFNTISFSGSVIVADNRLDALRKTSCRDSCELHDSLHYSQSTDI